MLWEVHSIALVQVWDHLGIATRREAVSVFEETCAQLEMVVELAVLSRPDRGVLVRERLVAGGHVDNAQAPGTDHDAEVRVNAAIIRPPMRHRVRHRLNVEVRCEFAQRTGDLDDATNSAHEPTLET